MEEVPCDKWDEWENFFYIKSGHYKPKQTTQEMVSQLMAFAEIQNARVRAQDAGK